MVQPVPKFSRETRGEGSSVQVTSFAPKHDCIGTKQGGHDSMDKSWQTWEPFSHSLWFPVKFLLGFMSWCKWLQRVYRFQEELTEVTSIPLLFPVPPHMGSWNVCVSHNIHLLDDVCDWSPDKWGWLALFTRFSLNLDFRPLSRELWRRAELKTGRCYFDIHNPHREMTFSNNTWLTMTKNSIFVLLKPFWIFHLFLEIILILSFSSDKRPEQSIAAARASVMVYDDLNKKWVPAGSSHGLSKVRQILCVLFLNLTPAALINKQFPLN